MCFVQLLIVKGGGVDRLQGNKVEDSWILVLQQVRIKTMENFLTVTILFTYNKGSLHVTAVVPWAVSRSFQHLVRRK